jgi:hypothetical protein
MLECLPLASLSNQIMFAGKAGAYPRVEHLIFFVSYETSYTKGRNGLSGTNTLAYFGHS